MEFPLDANKCPVVDIDFSEPGMQEICYPVYRELQNEAPVHQLAGTGEYLLTRYQDIERVLRDPQTFPSFSTGSDFRLIESEEANRIIEEEGFGRPFSPLPLATDPPVHRAYRKLVDKWINRAGGRRYSEFILQTIDELLDGWATGEPTEFVRTFAQPLPMRVIAHIIGFPAADIPLLKEWSDNFVRPHARGLSEEQEIAVAREVVEFQRYIHDVVEQRRRDPREDLTTHLAQAVFDGDPEGPRPLTDGEIVMTLAHVYTGGNETTTFALTSALWLMIDTPGIEGTLRSDPQMIPKFVNEALRLESPTQGLWRGVAKPVRIGDVDIPAGATVHLRYGAANRDPAAFPEPEDIRFDRKNGNRHLAFADGVHRCPGAGLSQLEQELTFDRLLSRFGSFRFADDLNDFEHLPGMTLRALRSLHIVAED